jgi:phosphatidylglycerophosphatase A
MAIGFGSGLAPIAPGTFGTLVAIPLYIAMAGLPISVYLALVVLTFIVGVWICGRTATALGVHDHPAIVWDEVVGYLITMIAAPPQWYWLLVGFLLFRIFDIVKPWPARYFDRYVKGGFGIMIDDVVAGIYALVVMQLFSTVT